MRQYRQQQKAQREEQQHQSKMSGVNEFQGMLLVHVQARALRRAAPNSTLTPSTIEMITTTTERMPHCTHHQRANLLRMDHLTGWRVM